MLDVFPIGQRSRTQNRTDLSRTKTKGRGEGASSSQQPGRAGEMFDTFQIFSTTSQILFSLARLENKFRFLKKIPHVLKCVSGVVVNDKRWRWCEVWNIGQPVTGRHAACHYPNGGSLVGHYTPIPHYATFTHLLYSRKPKKLTKKRISYRNIGYSSKV